MLLSVSGVGKSFSEQTVLRDVNFELDQAERALLLGPSGSGKSTLLNIICGLQRPDSGRVEIDGEVLADAGGAGERDDVRRRNLGIVFQTLRLVSALSLSANLELAQKLQTGSVDKAAIQVALERLGIAHRAHARPHELSQGEAQRAAIARALVVKPRLLLADEPTSALDVSVQAQVLDIIDDLVTGKGMGLILISHDLNLVSRYCDRILVMNSGEIVESCKASDLNKATHPYTRGLLAAMPRMDEDRDELPVLDRSTWTTGAGT